MSTGKKCQHRFGHIVIHDRVKLIALQPAMRLMPDLADDVGLGVYLLDTVTEFLPEGVIINFGGNIESPSIYTQLDPVFGDIEEKLSYRGGMRVEFGQGG